MSRNSSAADLLKNLIGCRSVTPRDDGALDVVQNYLTALGFACTRLPFDGDGSYGVDNLFATRGTGKKHLLFCGHTDVVPPGELSGWSHDPFSAHEADGEIWGRGAVDMKSGVAAFCAAAARYVAQADKSNGALSILITGDEEADAVNGTKKVLQWAAGKGHRFDFALVGEPTSAERFGDMIKIGRRGSMSGRVVVTGMQGHTAYPQLARNPLPVLAGIAAKLSGAVLDEGSQSFAPTNLQLTSLDVGNGATNVIPGSGELAFNIRFNDNWDQKTLTEWLRHTVASVQENGCDVNLEIKQPVAHAFVSNATPELDILADAIHAVCGLVPERSTSGGTSDARYIANYCPVAEFGLVGKMVHKTNERVSLAQLVDLCDVYAHFVNGFFGGTAPV